MTSKTTRFETLLEAVPDALVGMDQKGVIRFVNRQTESLFGFDRTQLIGEPVETLVPEPLWQIYAQHRDDYFADPRTRSSGLELELSGRRQDGTDFPVNVTLAHIDTGDVLLAITAVSDVVRQKRAVVSAELSSAIVEYSDDAIMSGTLEGIITSWNPAAERLYGYSSREIVGHSAQLLTPEDRTDEFLAKLAKARDGQVIDHFETVRVRKDGSRVPVSLTVAPIRDEDGAIVGLSVVHRDVTEQMRAFEASQRLAAIVDGSDDAIIGCTLEGVVTSWNPAAEGLFGYSGAEMVGGSAEAVCPEDRSDEMGDILAKVRAGQHVEHLETTRVRKDGSVFPVSLTVSPIRDAEGVIAGVSMINRNMTELKHAAEYARSLIEAGLDPLVTISPEGKINDVNEATVTATGVPRDELIGTDFSRYFTDPDKAQEGYGLAFAQGSVSDYPLTLRRPDGTLTDVLYNASVYGDAGGNVLGVFPAARDVTRQKKEFEATARLAAIVEYSDDAIYGLGLDDVITSWNPAAERMYGYSGAEIVGRPTVDLIIPESRASEMGAALAKVRAGEQVEHLETIRARKNGKVFPVSLTISPIRNETGSVVGASVICRDTTELRHAAEYSRGLIEASPDPLVTISPEGMITDVNHAMVAMTGVPRDRLIGTDFSHYATDPAKARAGYLLAYEQGLIRDYPLTLRRRPDGALTDVLYNATVYRDLDGEVLGVMATARDVTGQKEAFRAAQHMAGIIEGSDDAILSGSFDGLITSWNPAAERMYGYSGAEVIGKPAAFLAPPDRADEVSNVLALIKAGRQVERFESRRVRKDGTVFPVSVTVSPIRDADGAVVGTSVIHRDLTEEKRALAASQRMAAIVEYSQDAMISRTIDGIITSWNPAAERMFGYSGEEIIGKSINLLIPAEQAGEQISLLAKLSAGRPIENWETIRIRKDGTRFTVSLTLSPIRDDHGAIVGASVICRDVTEVRHAAEYARSLIEAALDPLVTISPEGKVTDVNEATVRVTGISRKKLIGSNFSQYFTDPDRAHAGYEQAFAQGSVTGYPLTLRHRDGTLTDVLYNASVYRDTGGNVLGVFAAAREVTGQKPSEEQPAE